MRNPASALCARTRSVEASATRHWGLDSRAAENIVLSRLENPFASLVELRDQRYVKTEALEKLYEYIY